MSLSNYFPSNKTEHLMVLLPRAFLAHDMKIGSARTKKKAANKLESIISSSFCDYETEYPLLIILPSTSEQTYPVILHLFKLFRRIFNLQNHKQDIDPPHAIVRPIITSITLQKTPSTLLSFTIASSAPSNHDRLSMSPLIWDKVQNLPEVQYMTQALKQVRPVMPQTFNVSLFLENENITREIADINTMIEHQTSTPLILTYTQFDAAIHYIMTHHLQDMFANTHALLQFFKQVQEMCHESPSSPITDELLQSAWNEAKAQTDDDFMTLDQGFATSFLFYFMQVNDAMKIGVSHFQ